MKYCVLVYAGQSTGVTFFVVDLQAVCSGGARIVTQLFFEITVILFHLNSTTGDRASSENLVILCFSVLSYFLFTCVFWNFSSMAQYIHICAKHIYLTPSVQSDSVTLCHKYAE